MDKAELINKINNPEISDETVFSDVKEWLNDDDFSSDELLLYDLSDFEEVGDLLRRVRPQITERLRLEIIQAHKNCCKPKRP